MKNIDKLKKETTKESEEKQLHLFGYKAEEGTEIKKAENTHFTKGRPFTIKI